MGSNKEPVVRIPVSKLKVGYYVDIGLPWTQHPFLFRRFLIKTEEELRVIRSLVDDRITVYPRRSKVTPADQSPPADLPKAATGGEEKGPEDLWEQKQQRVEKARSYRDQRRKLHAQYRETAQQVKRFTQDLSTAPANAIRDANEIVTDMVSHFEQESSVLMNLVNLPDGGYSSYAHSLNVTVLSLSLGRTLGLKGDDLRHIAMGALLHDVGLISLPPKIVRKTEPRTAPEEKLYQSHALAGAKLAGNMDEVDPAVADIIRHHHEMLDGSGYPEGRKGDAISKLTRIVSIANLYDNLCNPPDPKRARTPKLAMAALYRQYKGKVDATLLQHFIKSMGVYPPGTVVKLSDGSIALVITVDSEQLLHPTVIVYNPEIPRNEAVLLNLAETPELEVVDALKPSDYPQRIYDYLGIKERIGYFHGTFHGE